jgi:hypothetical protein
VNLTLLMHNISSCTAAVLPLLVSYKVGQIAVITTTLQRRKNKKLSTEEMCRHVND